MEKGKKRKKRKLRKPYRILRGIYIAVVIIAAIIVIVYGVSKFVIRPPDLPEESQPEQQALTADIPPDMQQGDHTRKEKTYTFLLAAPDQASGNADSIMVITYDVPNKKVGMLSVPRDTLVKGKNPKINASFHQGVDNLQEVVSDLVGFPLDFYITVDVQAFPTLVDAVGGVEFNVPVEMYYNDPSQDLNIFYQPGVQHLDGQQALEVCRFRANADGTGYPMGDVQRAETQRALLTTVAKKVVSWSNITRVQEFLDIIMDNVETDLSASNLAWFVMKGLELNLDTGVQGGSLPGDGSVTCRGTRFCYELYPEESLAMINSLVNPYTTPLTEDDVNIYQAP